MKRRKAITRYVKPYHYTQEELVDCDIADLQSDIECAKRHAEEMPHRREELLQYASDCEAKLAKLLANRTKS